MGEGPSPQEPVFDMPGERFVRRRLMSLRWQRDRSAVERVVRPAVGEVFLEHEVPGDWFQQAKIAAA